MQEEIILTDVQSETAIDAKETKSKSSKSPFIKKLKGIKNIEMIAAVVLAAIVMLVFFSSFNKTAQTSVDINDGSLASYGINLEKKSSEILSGIKGAGRVSVMITFDGGFEQVYAYKTEKITNSQGVTTETKEVVLQQGKPLIISEKAPRVKGVVVTCEGGGAISVKFDIINALTTLLDVKAENIEIFAKNK